MSLAEEIGGVKLRRSHDLNAPRGVAGRNSDNTMIKSILGWEPTTPFRVGLAKTYAWIAEQYQDRQCRPAYGSRHHLRSPCAMKTVTPQTLTDLIGAIPYRMALAGGWIDQPFVSRLNPSPPGSMVVVGLEPTCRFMERAGMATGTRNVALGLWNGRASRTASRPSWCASYMPRKITAKASPPARKT